MLINHDGRVTRNITGNFFLSFLIDETTKTSNINIMTVGHISLNNIEEGSTEAVTSDLSIPVFSEIWFDYVGLVHRNLRKVTKVNGQLFKRKMNLLIITKMTYKKMNISVEYHGF